jgi:hypothetical protein
MPAPSMFFYDGAGNRQLVKRIFFYDGAGNRQQVQRAFFYDGAGNRQKFYQNLQVFLQDTTANRNTVGTALSSFQLNADGFCYSTNVGGTLINRFQWLLGGAGSSVEAALTYLSGDALTSGPLSGNFVNLGSSQQWNLNNTVVSTKTNTSRCDIRPAGGGTIMATATITITATRTA